MEPEHEMELEEALWLVDKAAKANRDELKQALKGRSKQLRSLFREVRNQSLPPTSQRVPAHTREEVQAEIDAATVDNIARMINASKRAISRRLQELDREWDIERLLETNASALALTGLVLSQTSDRRWSLLSFGVLGFLLQHALQGWCPPVPFFRSRGVRTAREIEEERNALQLLRGDFGEIELESDDPLESALYLLELQRQ